MAKLAKQKQHHLHFKEETAYLRLLMGWQLLLGLTGMARTELLLP